MTYPLRAERLTIQPLSLDDLDAFVTYRRDPSVALFQSWDTSYSSEQGRALIEGQAGVLLPAPGEWLQLAIHSINDGELLGDLALHRLDDPQLTFEIGYTLAPLHQGKGFAREAVARLLQFLGNEVGATKVIATPDRRNEPSIRLLTALGFQLIPSKSWNEDFKGENVTVDYFEINLESKRTTQ